MKNFFAALILAVIFITGCETTKSVQQYDENGLPVWCGKIFTTKDGLWAGASVERGFYASGKSQASNRKLASNEAALDAKAKLSEFISEKLSADKSAGAVYLTGVRQVDFFDSDDGVTYVLYFISENDAWKSLGK